MVGTGSADICFLFSILRITINTLLIALHIRSVWMWQRWYGGGNIADAMMCAINCIHCWTTEDQALPRNQRHQSTMTMSGNTWLEECLPTTTLGCFILGYCVKCWKIMEWYSMSQYTAASTTLAPAQSEPKSSGDKITVSGLDCHDSVLSLCMQRKYQTHLRETMEKGAD